MNEIMDVANNGSTYPILRWYVHGVSYIDERLMKVNRCDNADANDDRAYCMLMNFWLTKRDSLVRNLAVIIIGTITVSSLSGCRSNQLGAERFQLREDFKFRSLPSAIPVANAAVRTEFEKFNATNGGRYKLEFDRLNEYICAAVFTTRNNRMFATISYNCEVTAPTDDPEARGPIAGFGFPLSFAVYVDLETGAASLDGF